GKVGDEAAPEVAEGSRRLVRSLSRAGCYAGGVVGIYLQIFDRYLLDHRYRIGELCVLDLNIGAGGRQAGLLRSEEQDEEPGHGHCDDGGLPVTTKPMLRAPSCGEGATAAGAAEVARGSSHHAPPAQRAIPRHQSWGDGGSYPSACSHRAEGRRSPSWPTQR